MAENQQLVGMPALGPTDGEPCQDCDDDNFEEGEGASADGGRDARPARVDPSPSDFDDDDQHVWKIHELRRLVRAVLLASR